MSQLRQRSPRDPAHATPNGSAAAAAPSYVSFPTPAQMDTDRRDAQQQQQSRLPAAPLVFARSASMDDDDDDLAAKTTPAQPKDRRSLAWTFVTFLFSAPALLGMCQQHTATAAAALQAATGRAEHGAAAEKLTRRHVFWLCAAGCWPSIVAAAIGGGVSGGARVLSHTISFYVTLTVLLAMLTYFAYCTRSRAQIYTGQHFRIYGPLYLLCVASLLILADPLRHILQDGGVWVGPSSNAFREGCGEGWACLTPTGIFFCVVFTYLGFLGMFTASAWNGNLLSKCRMCAREWKDIRQAHAKQALEDANAAREEAARARSSVGEAATMPTNSVAFTALHVTMAPPTFVFRAEQSNKLGGYRIKTSTPVGAAGDAPTPPASSTNRGSRRAMAEDSAISTPEAASTSAAPSPAGPVASHHGGQGSPSTSCSSSRSGEYKDEGYSYEVRSPAVLENVIKVSSARKDPPSQQQQQQQQPHVSSPTVTTSPSAVSALSTSSVGASLHPMYPSDSPASCSSSQGGDGGGGLAALSSPAFFSNVALTPAHPESKGSLTSPAPKHPSSHTPLHSARGTDSPAAAAANLVLSPHAQRFVTHQAAQLQEASSPFNAQKFRQAQQQQQQATIKQGEPV